MTISSHKSAIWIAFASVYLVWGSTYLAIRFTIETLPPFLSAGIRFVIAGLILFVYARLFRREARPTWTNWRAAAIVGGFLLLGGNGSVVWAEHFVPSGVAALIIAMTPLFMVLLQWMWDRAKLPSVAEFLGIALGFLGVWLLVAPDFSPGHAHRIHLGGALALLFACVSWAIGSIYSRRAPLPSSQIMATGMEMMCGGGWLVLAGLFTHEMAGFHWQQVSAKSFLAFLYLIVFGSLVGFSAYIWLLRNVGVARASTYAFVNPLVAVFLGWLLAHEPLNHNMVMAAGLVIAAVVLITFNPMHKRPA